MYGKKNLMQHKRMSLATVLQLRLGLCCGFLGYFGLYLEEIRFMVTSLQSREEHGSED